MPLGVNRRSAKQEVKEKARNRNKITLVLPTLGSRRMAFSSPPFKTRPATPHQLPGDPTIVSNELCFQPRSKPTSVYEGSLSVISNDPTNNGQNSLSFEGNTIPTTGGNPTFNTVTTNDLILPIQNTPNITPNSLQYLGDGNLSMDGSQVDVVTGFASATFDLSQMMSVTPGITITGEVSGQLVLSFRTFKSGIGVVSCVPSAPDGNGLARFSVLYTTLPPSTLGQPSFMLMCGLTDVLPLNIVGDLATDPSPTIALPINALLSDTSFPEVVGWLLISNPSNNPGESFIQLYLSTLSSITAGMTVTYYFSIGQACQLSNTYWAPSLLPSSVLTTALSKNSNQVRNKKRIAPVLIESQKEQDGTEQHHSKRTKLHE